VAINQFVNVGSKLKLESETPRRFVITGRASGTTIEAVIGAHQSFTVSASSESLKIDSFEAEPESAGALGALDFRMTE
jgi:hypothetical protein